MEQEFFSKSKLDRVLYLGERGFNIPKFYGVIDNIIELKEFYKKIGEQKVSIRTQPSPHSMRFSELGPHFPNSNIAELFDTLVNTLNQGYSLLMFEAIDPQFSELKGNILVNKKDKSILIEFTEGPGTVRSLESEHYGTIKQIKSTFAEYVSYSPPFFNEHSPSIILEIPFNCFILEFSKYKIPVGLRKMYEIFWEIRKGA